MNARNQNAHIGGEVGDLATQNCPQYTTNSPQVQAVYLGGGGSGVCFSTRATEARFDDGGRCVIPVERLTVEVCEAGLLHFTVCVGGVVTQRVHSGGYTISTVLAEVAG